MKVRRWFAAAKRFVLLLCILLAAANILLFVSLKYEHRIARKIGIDFSPSTILITPLSEYLPELFYKRNKQAIWTDGRGAMHDVYGHVDRHSIMPGEAFNLMLSTGMDLKSVDGHVEIFRIGYYGNNDRKLVWRSPSITVPHQDTRDSAASVGTSWKPIVKNISTDQWRTGFYDVDFVAIKGLRYPHVAFVVVQDPSFSGDVLVKLATNTYQAYNQWGGHSLYKSKFMGKGQRGYMVSFDRPVPNGEFNDFYTWEHSLIHWLEKLAAEQNFSVHYATNWDVSTHPELTRNYALLISSGHDEYWTREEFENTYQRIFKLGKNTIFFGANTAYWQVRYADVNQSSDSVGRGRQMICYKSIDDPIRYRDKDHWLSNVTAMFRDQARTPETMLMGVAYQSFAHGPSQDYYVKDTGLPFFRGTGYIIGERVNRIIGHEWDNRDPARNGKRLFEPGVSMIKEIPEEDITVLLSGKTKDVDGESGQAEAVYFVSKAGGKVFSSGTNNWVKGLTREGAAWEKFRRLNENIIMYFLDKDMGRQE